MRKLLYFILKLYLFWIIYFLINRIFFFLFFFSEISEINFLDLLNVIPNSLPLDFSFISYFVSIIIILSFLSLIGNIKLNKFLFQFLVWFNIIFLLLSGLIIGSEIALYSEWSTKLNFTALRHLENPSEVFSTASWVHISTLFFFLFISLIFVWFFKKYFYQNPYSYTNHVFLYKIKSSIFYFMLLVISFILIRGGVNPIPISISNAYFSNHVILNDISVNSNWNLLQGLLNSKTSFKGNPYHKYNDSDIQDFISGLHMIDTVPPIQILTHTQPNIVFILLESWSADNIESLGGFSGITPNFERLEEQGYLFNDIYSNGWTSDQSMSSIFSAFPVFPSVGIVNEPDKSRKLPSLNKSLPDAYHSSYFFGGQLTYGNIKAYLLNNEFSLVKDQEDYPTLSKGGLGIHDGDMFSQFKVELSQLPQPFMSVLFTLSSHSPYDFPGGRNLSFNSREDDYVNSVAYTDKCLGSFMNSVKDEDWYENTLFVIVADHSHNSPKKWRYAQKERFKIPMLWYGDALKEEFRGGVNSKIGSHLDITPTILNQLNCSSSLDYKWGQDLLNPNTESFVPYTFPGGYGWIRDDGYYAFSESYKKALENHALKDIDKKRYKKEAELFFQAAFQEYMDL